ncbi:hypothetical protein [Mycoplasma sp. Ms02]|uniref:hypothetical protein n=1 Tax=Mycoplasma sp. Ms02 TaxID=353851 RepID=UPI001C8AA081|nr:hypothetical protein [Mycoplasma sp. Ms02]QZE12447.1 hypothetical protein K4L35_00430 [Mycoplasma sp. Ms02]
MKKNINKKLVKFSFIFVIPYLIFRRQKSQLLQLENEMKNLILLIEAQMIKKQESYSRFLEVKNINNVQINDPFETIKNNLNFDLKKRSKDLKKVYKNLNEFEIDLNIKAKNEIKEIIKIVEQENTIALQLFENSRVKYNEILGGLFNSLHTENANKQAIETFVK